MPEVIVKNFKKEFIVFQTEYQLQITLTVEFGNPKEPTKLNDAQLQLLKEFLHLVKQEINRTEPQTVPQGYYHGEFV